MSARRRRTRPFVLTTPSACCYDAAPRKADGRMARIDYPQLRENSAEQLLALEEQMTRAVERERERKRQEEEEAARKKRKKRKRRARSKD